MTPSFQSYPQFGWSDPYAPGLSGLGASTTGNIVISAPQIVGGVLTSVAAAPTAAGTAAGIWGMSATVAIPIIGAAVAGVTLALMAWFNRKGPHQKVETTKIVNELEPYLLQNLQGYQAGPHTRSSQAQALANFDAVWQTLKENCDQEQYGEPGKRCVSDRQAGSCEWKDAGQCWNWFVGYRDPIANDPNVKPDPVLGSAGELIDSLTGGIFSTSSGGSGTYLLLAGILLFAAFAFGGSK